MPKLKLTKTNIDTKAKPSPLGDVIYWDTVTRGFGVRVTPKGAMSFVLQSRLRGEERDVRVTIGSVGPWLLDSYDDRDARRKAQELKQQFEDGIDPRAKAKEEAAQKVTLGEVAKKYLARPGALKPTSEKWTRYYVEKVFADWSDKPITSITRDMVRERHAQLAEGGFKGLNPTSTKDKRKVRPSPATANASMIVLRILIQFAADEYRLADGKSLITDNPVDAMKRHWAPAGDRTGRYIDKRKVGEVWNALHAERVKPMPEDSLAGIDLALMLLLTGARRMEIAALTWDRVNIDHTDPSQCWFHLPDPKSGREVFLPLSKQAVVILESRKRVKGNPYVFPTRSKAGHIGDPRAPFELISKVVGMHLSAHDLRRTWTNIAMRECLIEKFRTDLLTCHVPSHADTTARHYLDLKKLDWLYPETQRVSDWIEQAGRVAAGANVVPMERPA